MNIFILDTNPVLAAQMQCDKHCVKQVLESAQILSTVAGGPYKPTHANHPCVLWAGANKTNYNWLARHAIALCEEYTRRYGRRHKSQDVIEQLQQAPNLPVGITPFVQCMPEQFKDRDTVTAYRRYYHSKSDFAVWKLGNEPYWWNDETYLRIAA